MPGAEAAAAYGAGAPAHDVGPLVRALNIHQCAVQPSGSTGPLLQRRGRVQP
jgi:hypothetical protein